MGMSVYVLLTTLELIVTSNRVAVTVANAPLVHSASIPQMDTNVSAQMDTMDNSVRQKSMYVKKDKESSMVTPVTAKMCASVLKNIMTNLANNLWKIKRIIRAYYLFL